MTTAREIIEARIGRTLPAPKDMRPDERRAVSMLGKQLVKAKLHANRDIAEEARKAGI